MDVQVFLYDSFTHETFGGNPAGVVLDAISLGPETMQKIAAELNAPTTGFVIGYEVGIQPTYLVRYFTPRQEIDLCGHVTIALFTALAANGNCQVQREGTRLGLRTSAGELSVLLRLGDNRSLQVEMEQNLPYFETPSALEWGAVQEVLGDVPLHSFLPVEIASTGLRHLIVPFSSYADLSRLNPDFEMIKRLSQLSKVDTVRAFAPSAREPSHMRMRDFCSGIGDNEEPASGTTSGALTCYLFRHRFAPADEFGELRVYVEQGVEMGRPSQIEARLTVRDGNVQRVAVQGQAMLVLEGSMRIP
jgi:PhzF family phenazine biosynthesis protein